VFGTGVWRPPSPITVTRAAGPDPGFDGAVVAGAENVGFGAQSTLSDASAPRSTG